MVIASILSASWYTALVFDVREEPAVFFRVSANTWVEAIVRYLVDPRQSGRVKTRILTTALERLNAEPDRVLFPKSNLR